MRLGLIANWWQDFGAWRSIVASVGCFLSLDGALSIVIRLKMPLPVGLELDGLQGPFQAKHFHDSVIL